MNTKTYFAFRVVVWDGAGDNIVEHALYGYAKGGAGRPYCRAEWTLGESSAPVSLGCADNSNYTEHKKDRAENSMIHNQGRASWRPFPLPIRKGAARSLPPLARDDGLEPVMLSPQARRQAIFPGVAEPRAIRPETPAAVLASLVGQDRLAAWEA